jgi:phosphatidylserine/phosphatidylglycerophosphate/cardiolipin synthase-like enzyme
MKRTILFLFTALFTAALYSQPSNHVVISEVAPMGGGSTTFNTGEFIELYNPTPVDIVFGANVQLISGNISGTNAAEWQLSLAGKTIKAYGFFLIGDGGVPTADLAFPSPGTKNLANSGIRSCVHLRDGAAVIDAFGWDQATSPSLLAETQSFKPSSTSGAKSFERKSGGLATTGDTLGNAWDSNNNSTDFFENALAKMNPQNSSSKIEINPYQTGPANPGTALLNPKRWKYNSPTNLVVSFKSSVDTIRAIKIVKPNLFTWNNASITVSPSSIVKQISGDTIILKDFSIIGADSILVTIPAVTSTDSTNEFSLNILSSRDGISFSGIAAQPLTLVYGTPRPISMVKKKEPSGVHSFFGKWAVVRGIVTVGSEFGGPTYVQDPTAGMALYDSSVTNNVNRGDDVILLGLVAPFNDLFEFAPSVLLEKLGEGIGTDTTVITIAQALAQGTAEPQEGRLVRINNITSVTTTAGAPATSWAASASGTNYNISDGTGTLQVRIVTRTNIANTPTPSSLFDMVGVLGQFTTNYQIIPRMVDDIIVEGAGPRIVTAAPYESEMTATGMKLSWVTDAPGTSIVKYGPTTAYGQEAIENTPKTQHAVTLTGLTPATVYHFQIGSMNANGTTLASDHVAITSSQTSSGTMNVYFSKSVNTGISIGEQAKVAKFDTVLINRINAAAFSIDMAAYSLSGTVGADIANALLAARNRGVKIRVIGEKDNQGTAPWTTLKNAGVTVIDDGYDVVNAAAGLMHNKFYVFDNRDHSSDKDDWVLTGSWNATDPGTNNDAQNIIVIQDKALATAYTMEFEEMWGAATDGPNAAGSRFGARKLDNTPHKFMIAGTPVEVYFSPSDKVTTQINKALSSSQNSINVALLSFTRDELAQTIVAKKTAGKKTRVLMDNNTDSGNDFTYLLTNGVDVRLPGAALTGLLHHKYAIVDAETPSDNNIVVTGSHNWSSSAEIANNENTLIIQSKRIANLYLQEFKSRYMEAGGTDTIAASVRKNTNQVPDVYALTQNYPNPFNPSTQFNFSVKQTGPVTLKVYDLIGREIATLVNGEVSAGSYRVEWNAAQLSSGVYFYQLRAGEFVSTKKMILQK